MLDVGVMVIAETLAAGSKTVDMLGRRLKVDMAELWEADDIFSELIRDRQLLAAILADVADRGRPPPTRVQRASFSRALSGTASPAPMAALLAATAPLQ